VSITSQLLLSFVSMDYQALMARPPAVVDSFQQNLTESLCGILDAWVKDPATIWRPSNSNSSSSTTGQMAETQPAALWQQLPASLVQYSCTINNLKAGSVLVNMTIASTAGLTGAAASASNNTDAVENLGFLLEERVNLLGSMLGAGAALSPGFHTGYTTGDKVVVVRMEHAWANDPEGGAGDAAAGSSSSRWTAGLQRRLLAGVIVAGVVGVGLGIGLVLFLRRERRAGLHALVLHQAPSRKQRQGPQLTRSATAAAAARQSAGSSAAAGGNEEDPAGVGADLEPSIRSFTAQISRHGDGFDPSRAAAGAHAAKNSGGGRPKRVALSVHVTGHSEESPEASPGDVMLVPVTTPRRTAGRSWRMVRNLQAAAHAITTSQAQTGSGHASSPRQVRHTPVTPGVTRSPRAAWGEGPTAGGHQASSPRLAASHIPDAALLEAMQRSQLHGRHLLTDLNASR
jgi:hypothetical protein